MIMRASPLILVQKALFQLYCMNRNKLYVLMSLSSIYMLVPRSRTCVYKPCFYRLPFFLGVLSSLHSQHFTCNSAFLEFNPADYQHQGYESSLLLSPHMKLDTLSDTWVAALAPQFNRCVLLRNDFA